MSAKYRVLLEHRVDHQPLVYVLDPALEPPKDTPLPHVYDLDCLCLFLPETDEWGPGDLIAKTLIPWVSEWLFFYELWLVTGEWYGGGVHPSPSASNRADRRSIAQVRRAKRARLACAIKEVRDM